MLTRVSFPMYIFYTQVSSLLINGVLITVSNQLCTEFQVVKFRQQNSFKGGQEATTVKWQEKL